LRETHTRHSLQEHYLVGPLDTSDESAWRTEIGWPIVKVAERPH
jgi:hypothetical protein